jgi:hypothetical protein
VQPSREAFSVLCLLIWFGCVVRCFRNGEEASRIGVLISFKQLSGWNRSFGNWKRVCVVYDCNGQSTCRRRFLKRSANTRGTFMELEAGAHRSARRTASTVRSKAVPSKVHTRQVYLCPQALLPVKLKIQASLNLGRALVESKVVGCSRADVPR